MVFVDLADSTAAYAALGNAPVAEVVSKVTQWIGRVCDAHQGRIVKYLGDGVLAQFADAQQAIEAVVFMQQSHTDRLRKWPEPLHMGLKIGMACGAVVHKDGDTYGDPVNLAARLSDLAGAHTIWADDTVITHLRQTHPRNSPVVDKVRYRSLGLIRVRGLAQPQSVFQIEWNEELSSDLMTVRGALHDLSRDAQSSGASIALAWLGTSRVFSVSDMPVTIGRTPDSTSTLAGRPAWASAALSWSFTAGSFLSSLSAISTRYSAWLLARVRCGLVGASVWSPPPWKLATAPTRAGTAPAV